MSQTGSQARSRTRPPSRAESASGNSDPRWAQHVGWDTKIRPLDDAEYDHLPKIKELRELVQQSFTVPAWLANPESSQYPYKNRCRDDIEQLANNISAPRYTIVEDDMTLSTDVEECLPNLLLIVRQVDALQVLGLGPLEADRRHPIDTLGSLVWDIQSDRLVYRLERPLQIPGPPNHFIYTKPGACALIRTPNTPARVILPHLQSALSCFPRTKSGRKECRFVLHWVTEFKHAIDEELSKMQVVEGLVSALHQRRALGFPNHFVFGTAHHSETFLEVLAATWIPTEPIGPRADSMQEVDPQSVVPPADQKDDPAGNSSLKGDTTDRASEAGPKLAGAGGNLTAKDIKKYNKIVVYSIATYSMMLVEDLLRLYLLMRHTRFSADEYQKEIMERGGALIAELSREAPGIYRWPPPPLPDTGPQKTTSKKRKLDGLSEESMSVDGHDDSDSGSDQEEPDSASDVGCKHGVIGDSYVQTVTGDVATYTLKNYAYEADAGAGIIGDP